MDLFEFNHAPSKPVVNLAVANGFPPETYAAALQPLFDRFHVVSVVVRPLRGDCPPESIQRWSQFGDDILEGLAGLTDQPVMAVGHSFGGIATMYAAVKNPKRFSRIVLLDPTLLPPYFLFGVWLARRFGKE